jgi:hypothetical protein
MNGPKRAEENTVDHWYREEDWANRLPKHREVGGGRSTQWGKHFGPYGATSEGLYRETSLLSREVYNVANRWCIQYPQYFRKSIYGSTSRPEESIV